MEAPGPEGSPDWDSLYLYRGDEVEVARPAFTGDVFVKAEVQGVGKIEYKDVIVLQHPCALRTDGLHLADSLIVAEVVPDRFYEASEWQGNYKVMPLPFLTNDPDDPSHCSAGFTSIHLAIPASLDPAKRVASMTPLGVNLLLQRWVYHNSRGLLPTWKYNEVTIGAYEEADGIEEWCSIRMPKGVTLDDAAQEATNWLDDKTDIGVPRRFHLDNDQLRSSVRKKMRQAARALPNPPRRGRGR